jgi:hypothetical protein
MRTYLLPDGANWYRANLHCHTIHSDGYWPPERVKEEYRKAGYSVVAYTDHDVLVPHNDLTDENFVALTSTELDVTAQKVPEDERPEFTAKGHPWRYRPTHHFNLFSKVPDPGPMPFHHDIWSVWYKAFEGTEEEKQRRAVWNVENVQHLIDEANKAGFLVQYNHPNWSLAEPQHFLPLKGLWSLEILNWATEVETGGEYCPYVYDMMLRRTGPSLFCSMGDDNHNHGGDLMQSFGGSTMFGAKELTYDAIVQSMVKGEFYCTEGRLDPPRILALYVESGVVHVDCTPASFVFFVGDGRRYANKRGEGVTHAEFPLGRDDGWFRVAVRDDRGNTAHTHAYPAADCR